MATMFHRRLLMALLVSLAFAAFPEFTFANHQWGTYRWKIERAPFTLWLGDSLSLSSLWSDYLTSATYGGLNSKGESKKGWNDSPVLDLVIKPGNAGSNPRKCPPTNGRVEVCNYKYGTNGWLGVAQIWLTGGFISQATVKLNDSYFFNNRFPKYALSQWRNMVMCQEVGHTFGLDHQDETFNNYNLGSCMDYTNYPDGGLHSGVDYGPSNEYPGGTVTGDSDFEELCNIYCDKTDGGTTVVTSSTPTSGPGKGKKSPSANNKPVELGTAQWGHLIRSTNNGRTETYELDLGQGHKVLTHVIWADPEDQPANARGRR